MQTYGDTRTENFNFMKNAVIEFHPSWAGPVRLLSYCQAKNLLLSTYFLPLYNSTHQVMMTQMV
jgi:hypothetical protein